MPVEDGDIIELGNRTLEVITIPGHTPGSIAVLDIENRVLYGGDTVQDGKIFMFGVQREFHAYIRSLESLFFGLSLRQLLFALLAILVAVGVYLGLKDIVGTGEIGWMCVLAAFPFALGGFFTYNGMTFERFLLAVIRSELLNPRKLVFEDKGHGDDFATMWDIIMALLRAEWFLDCASSCVWQDEDDEEDVLAQAGKMRGAV